MLSRRLFLSVATFATLLPSGVFADDHVLTASDANTGMLDGSLILIDVRRPEEWVETGVAEGAWLLDMTDENFGAYVAAILDRNPNHDVAVICRTGNRTGRLMSAFAKAGMTGIKDVSEGMVGGPRGTGWIKTGLPLQDAHTAYDAMPKDLTAR